MPAPESVYQLVQRFKEQRQAYCDGKYNETQLRRDFLDKFFEALGWDVANSKGNAEKYREVVHEASVEVEGHAKAADYAFHIGPELIFFVEAKKPSVNIETNPDPAFQIRRYGWSARLALSILTDFEQLAIYDCRIKPRQGDLPSVGRVKLYGFSDYIDKWDEIAGILSREAVLHGAFEQFAEGTKGKRGTTDVDDAFLEEMERWREALAHNIALRNPALNQREINIAVLNTINRLIFLRICEDRGIEPEDALRNATDGKDVYGDLLERFKLADKKYNSGLFHFYAEKGQSSGADSLALNLKMDDKVLKDVLAHLYYPVSPYAFKYIPVDILGQVYERFLGKVIRLTGGHQAKVEEKPEVRKAGGVFYTPTYIVNYIVKNTLGERLREQTPAEQSKAPLRLVDPACGSGSFLLGAYQFLLDWYLDWYLQNEPGRWARGKAPAIMETQDGWMLTMDKKKEILLNHIFGVDIDAQAVEVTKLSLLLKVVEKPGQLSLLAERILPDLGQNIRCGNSLIGPEYYDNRQLPMFGDEESYRVNIFDWVKAFPQAFKTGGFDVVIGNPPYVRQEGLLEYKDYLEKKYSVFRSTADLYVYFIEKGLKLLNSNGLFGMIVSNKWIRAAYGEPLREYLRTHSTIKKVIDFAGLPVFEDATVRTIIIICKPGKEEEANFSYMAPLSKDEFNIVTSSHQLEEMVSRKSISVKIPALSKEGWSFSGEDDARIIETLKKHSKLLKKYVPRKPYFGIKTGRNEAYIIDRDTKNRLVEANPECEEVIKPLVVGRDIRRYSLKYQDRFLIWAYIGIPIKKYPAIFEYLKDFKKDLENRWDKGNEWWELRACDYYDKFTGPKIIYPDISTSCRFTLDRKGFFGINTTYFIPGDDLYLLGILNSKLANYYFSKVCAGLEGGGTIYLRFFGEYLEEFPVHIVDESNHQEMAGRERLVTLTNNMLELHENLSAAQMPQDKELIQRHIEVTDRQIDRLVYALYGLSEAEIQIVEGA